MPRKLGLPDLADADEEWIDEPEEVIAEAPARRSPREPAREPTTGRNRRKVPRDVANELTDVVGPVRAGKLSERLADATRAYDRERYADARSILKRLVEEAPDSAAVQELYGLALYRLGHWSESARHLDAYHTLSGSYDQHPVLADCARALGRYERVEELWDELRRASPGASLTAEGRIVAAGARADQGDVRSAIKLMEATRLQPRAPKPHHLRLWYVLADLYERAGDIPRARELFQRVASVEPDAFDVSDRLRSLR